MQSSVRAVHRQRHVVPRTLTGVRYIVGGAAAAWVVWLVILLAAGPATHSTAQVTTSASNVTR